MSSELLIFDRNLLQKRRSSSAASLPKADFLIKHSLADILERLNEMSIKFPLALNLGSRSGFGSKELSKRSGTIKVVDTDLSLELLKNNPNLNKLAIDEENLCFADNSFNLIISILNLHLINDLPGCLIQLNKMLKPGGVLIASLFGERNLPELRETILKTELEQFGGASPRIIPSIDIKQLGGLLQRAGFSMQIVDKETIKAHYPSPLSLLHDLKNMGETNIMLNRNKKYLGKEFWQKFNENYINEHSNDTNSVYANFEILTLTAIK